MNPLLTIEPEFQSLIPPLSDEEFALLKQQIREQGCLEPLYVWKDGDNRILLDGHNRYRICSENNLPFTFVKVPLASHQEAKMWILEHQVGRRNLTDDQRAAMWNDIRELRSKFVQAEKLQKARDVKAGIAPIAVESPEIDQPKKDTRAEIAKEAKLPESKLRQAQRLKKYQPAVYEKVRTGELTLRNAAKELGAGRKKARVPQNHDYFRHLGHLLDGVFKGALKEKLDTVVHLNQKDLTPATRKSLQELISILADVSKHADGYATKFKAILQSNKKAEAA